MYLYVYIYIHTDTQIHMHTHIYIYKILDVPQNSLCESSPHKRGNVLSDRLMK